MATNVTPGTNVKVRIEDGIAWVSLNRPEKRNAISPGIVFEMVAAIDQLEMNDDAKVIVITGSGEAFSAGQDLKEYFRIPDAGDPRERERLHNANAYWQWRRLMYYPKPTIAMVNGWCFGGARAISRSPRRTRNSASPRSTGASSPPAS
jgi:trans-feruloyl-CoA hydratase/vanillin synthase